jgi:hypothetical protein
MTSADRDILNGILQVLENLTVGLDAVEGALIHEGLLTNGQRQQFEPNYRQAAISDLAVLRMKVASLRSAS